MKRQNHRITRAAMAAAIALLPAAGLAQGAGETIKLTVINSSETDVPICRSRRADSTTSSPRV